MRVKVITRHAPSNYGSLLQALATVTAIEKMGHECQIIDYVRADEMGLKALLVQLRQKPCYNNNLVKRLAYILIRYPDEKWAELKFRQMRKHYLKMTQSCHCSSDLQRLDADIFMTGSDQVWGPVADADYDGAYFLDFTKDCTKRIAYSASIGRTELPKDALEKYKEMLSRYDSIAVRENTVVDMLAQWGMINVKQVLDPVFLLSAEEWNKIIRREQKNDYVLVYQIHNDSKLNDYAIRFADKCGMPLRRVSPFMRQIGRGGRLIHLPDIREFLSLIKGCSYLITDSFHGTAFGLIFNRQFVEVLPNNKTGSRNQSILELVGLTDRILKNYDDYSFIQNRIDYGKVNDVLNKERGKSLNILRNMLMQ